MGTEESDNNAAPPARSWLRHLVWPCGAETSSGCGCLCPCLHGRSQEPRPTGWFEVHDGQLQSNAEPKQRKRKRRKKKKKPSSVLAQERERDNANNTAAIINRPTGVTSNASESGDAVSAKHPNREGRGGPVSDLLKHLLRAAQDASSQSSAPPSCDDTTPPLLRSDEQDRYQPDVVMEMASSPQTEGEVEQIMRDRCL